MVNRSKTVAVQAGRHLQREQLVHLVPAKHNLTQMLLDEGEVDAAHLFKALALRGKRTTPVERVLLANEWLTPEALAKVQARLWDTIVIDPAATPAHLGLIARLGPSYCLKHRIVPLSADDGITLIATSRPEQFETVEGKIAGVTGRRVRMVLCTDQQIETALVALGSSEMIRQAESRVPEKQSCRSHNSVLFAGLVLLGIGALAWSDWYSLSAALFFLTALILTGLLLQVSLRLACLVCSFRKHKPALNRREACSGEHDFPTISVIVPLYKEAAILGALVERLHRLRYPRELMEIFLAVEEGDQLTGSALKAIRLPPWLRVVEVPKGAIKTKPRALNYVLNFCHGDIIGIWDAEDQPEPDQLQKIAAHFHHAPKNVGCVQGVLDFYNPRTNGLARFFTIEYAAWFRVMLPAIARMGFVVPLGGTTCFFRREALEHVDAWDAWNVTEDADLGVRLARCGWRTEIARTTTYEEANCRIVPWIKQRSRWLKGYGLTWCVHMRNPHGLWRDLGTLRFIGFQVQFFFMLSQHLLAPAIASFWLLSFRIAAPYHPAIGSVYGHVAPQLLFWLLVGTEALGTILNMRAVNRPGHRHLFAWTPFMLVYFPMAAIATWKAAFEFVLRPYYWDKTAHGVFSSADQLNERPVNAQRTVPIPSMGRIGDEKPHQDLRHRVARTNADGSATPSRKSG